MNKDALLQELSAKIESGEIQREEVTARLNTAENMAEDHGMGIVKLPHVSVTKILYILGATIVLIGIAFFVAQIWDDINSFGRIAITLGLGLLVAAIGSVLMQQKPEENLGAIFHLIGGILIPGGIAVTLYELDIDSDWTYALTFGSLFIAYLLLSTVHKHAILTFFAIVNGTVPAYLLLNAIINTTDLPFNASLLFEYLTMAIGLSYLLLAHTFRTGWNRYLIGALYFFGSTAFLGATFMQVYDSFVWELLYFIIVIGGLLFSAYVKSRSVLVMSTIFLIAHFTYVTGEHFADSLGWPISLVLLGFIIIALGYASITINKKYINKAA